jgi:ribosome maturation factor RimP
VIAAEGDADEEVEMPGGLRSTAGKVDDRKLAGLIEPAVAAAGMDLESVRVIAAGRSRRLLVVVDSDKGVSLDDAADVSRDVWRRARGRLVRVKVAGEGSVEGRVLAADAEGVTLGIAGGKGAESERRFRHADLGAGSVQVEFGRIPDAELDDFSDPELDDTVSDDDTDLGAGGDGH